MHGIVDMSRNHEHHMKRIIRDSPCFSDRGRSAAQLPVCSHREIAVTKHYGGGFSRPEFKPR